MQPLEGDVDCENGALRGRQGKLSKRLAGEHAIDGEAQPLSGLFAAALDRCERNVGRLGELEDDRVAGLGAELGGERFADERLASRQRRYRMAAVKIKEAIVDAVDHHPAR